MCSMEQVVAWVQLPPTPSNVKEIILWEEHYSQENSGNQIK